MRNFKSYTRTPHKLSLYQKQARGKVEKQHELNELNFTRPTHCKAFPFQNSLYRKERLKFLRDFVNDFLPKQAKISKFVNFTLLQNLLLYYAIPCELVKSERATFQYFARLFKLFAPITPTPYTAKADITRLTPQQNTAKAHNNAFSHFAPSQKNLKFALFTLQNLHFLPLCDLSQNPQHRAKTQTPRENFRLAC